MCGLQSISYITPTSSTHDFAAEGASPGRTGRESNSKPISETRRCVAILSSQMLDIGSDLTGPITIVYVAIRYPIPSHSEKHLLPLFATRDWDISRVVMQAPRCKRVNSFITKVHRCRALSKTFGLNMGVPLSDSFCPHASGFTRPEFTARVLLSPYLISCSLCAPLPCTRLVSRLLKYAS